MAEQLRDALDGPSPMLAQSGVNDDGSPLAVSDPNTGETISTLFDEDTGRALAAIDYAQRQLALPQLKQLINYSAQKLRFAIELKAGRRVHVGGTPELRRPEVIADLIADATDRYPPAFIGAKVPTRRRGPRLVAELEDHGVSPSDETRAMARQARDLPDILNYVRGMRLAPITLPDLSERIQTRG